MLIKAQIKALPFGSKFTLHPRSEKFWLKSQEHRKPDGTVIRVKAARNECGGESYFEPTHVVYKLA